MSEWYNQNENKVRLIRRLKSPYDNLVTGSSPLDGMTNSFAKQFDNYINLAENPLYYFDEDKPKKDTHYYWIPIEELKPWGTFSFLNAKFILDYAYEKHQETYMHCHVGTNRSPCMAMAWLTSRGHSLEDAAGIVSERPDLFVRKYLLNVKQGYIPENLSDYFQDLEIK